MRKILKKSTPKKGSKKKWKKYEKTFKKLSKKEVNMKKKPSKNRCEKKDDFWRRFAGTPGEKGNPTNNTKSTRNIQTFHTNPTMSEEGECEEGEWRRVSVKRWLQKTNFNHPTRLGRLQARSGYIWAQDRPGYPVKWRKALRTPVLHGGSGVPRGILRAPSPQKC